MRVHHLPSVSRWAILTSVAFCCACSDEAAAPDATASPAAEKLGSTSQALDDPDGLITPDFATSYLPLNFQALAGDLSTLAGVFSNAKSVLAVTQQLGELLGILERANPNAQFDKLAEDIKHVARELDWKGTMVPIDEWKGRARWAVESVAHGAVTVPGQDADAFSGSAVNAILESGEVAFYRVFQPSATEGWWTEVLRNPNDRSKPDPDHGDQAYDWRLGMPALMQLIAYRIQVIAAMNPNFRWDNSRTGYKDELRRLRAGLQYQRDKMLSGVRCASTFTVGRALGPGQACADVNTGIYALFGAGQWNAFPAQAEADEIIQRLRTKLYAALPFFEVQSMIDTLTLYINGTQDLTEATSDIRLAGNPGLCLDIQNGDPTPGTPLWAWPCTGDAAQYWQYDRTNGTIYNPVYGQCLDQTPHERFYPGTVPQGDAVQGIADGSSVVTSWCDGSRGQKWTYDPDSQALQNGYGLVLRASSLDVAASVNVYAGPPHPEVAGEKWQAPQRPVGPRSAPLFRYPNGELHAWDTLFASRYKDIYIGSADLGWQVVGTGNFDFDRHPDLLWRHAGASLVSTWSLDENLQPIDYPPAADHAPEGQPWTGDLDGNGVSDIVWTRGGWEASGSGAGYFAMTETWWMGAGATEPNLIDLRPSTEERVIAVGDFDGDAAHVADRLYASKDRVMRIALAGGSSYSFLTGDWQAMGTGDFNADGTDDVLYFIPETSDVFVGVVKNGQPVSSTILGSVPPSTGWTIQGVGDIDGDGVCDIIWRHTDGTIGYWLMNDPSSVRAYPTVPLSPDIAFSGVIRLGGN